MKSNDEYYLGLDIGTDSVGYAVTDTNYALKKFKSEYMWGSHLFDAANTSQERRLHRIARRRYERRRQRIDLLRGLFTPEICKIDPNFFIRRKESALFPEDSKHGVKIFDGGGFTDKAYHKKYPTIHHLICELMDSDGPHDVRLVYLACAWLVKHRGHFLLDVGPDNVKDILDFGKVYEGFQNYIRENDWNLPWNGDEACETIRSVLEKNIGVNKKYEELKQKLFGGKASKKIKDDADDLPMSADSIIRLLAGKTEKLKGLFGESMEYDDKVAVSLVMKDEEFIATISVLDDVVRELFIRLRNLVDCARLISTLGNHKSISESRVAVYDQHRKDLKALKAFIRKYCPEKYDEIFKIVKKSTKEENGKNGENNDNYARYSKNIKKGRIISKSGKNDAKFVDKEAFSKFLMKHVKNLGIDKNDRLSREFYDDMMERLELRSFLPRQRDTDNRRIPCQLWRHELEVILTRAKANLSFLNDEDVDGLSVYDKIISIFDFKIPYYVGPLSGSEGQTKNAWMIRKSQGKILPWNFDEKVDLDRSEEEFIKRMTNVCTFLPDKDVLPACSLLYNKYVVLEELNNLRINNVPLTLAEKRKLYHEVFEVEKRVTIKKIKDCLNVESSDSLSVEKWNSSLKTYHIFRNLLTNGTLTEDEVEEIVRRAAYSEDRNRLRRWLRDEYPKLKPEDVDYLVGQNFKGFGRLSKELLTGIRGKRKGSDSEETTIIDALWETSDNLMQLRSDKYTFKEKIEAYVREYYGDKRLTLDERLSKEYVSNSVKRPIFRALDVVSDVVKAMGGKQPSRIFIEMARGGKPEQKGKTIDCRKEQLMALYKSAQKDAKELKDELKQLGIVLKNMDDASLRKNNLYLYFLQLGRCAYTGEPIELRALLDGDAYNREHIYPQSYVKDDSLQNNIVLVKSEVNGLKKDSYPVASEIQDKMWNFWTLLKKSKLMTEEKYRRLTRKAGFTDDEKRGFIARQLVETRQSSKVLPLLLKERYPKAEIVYVKAGLVSDFRQEYKLVKSRTINDLHHAKDAFLSIVVGNVYHERFTSKWFNIVDGYSVKTKTLFNTWQSHKDFCYWRGERDVARVKETLSKTSVHLTRYAFCRQGCLFDVQAKKVGFGQFPRKKGLSVEKYGGYGALTASFFVLAVYDRKIRSKIKREATLVPVRLLDSVRFHLDPEFAVGRIKETIKETYSNIEPCNIVFPLGLRTLKIGAILALDGAFVTLSGSASNGAQIIMPPFEPLLVGDDWEKYVKKLESFQKRWNDNKKLEPDEEHDGLLEKRNLELFDLLVKKLGKRPYCKIPGNLSRSLSEKEARKRFGEADGSKQVNFLLELISYMNGRKNECNLSVVGGKSGGAKVVISSYLSTWANDYKDVRIVDRSASGLFEKRSGNILDYLK